MDTKSRFGSDCPAKCAQAANGVPGCCEWQWNVNDDDMCIFVPEETTKPSNLFRSAIRCGMYNIIHD